MKQQWVRVPFLALAVIALFATFGVSRAYAPQDDQARYEIPLRSFDLQNYSSVVTQQSAAQAAANLESRYGGTWEVYSWNPQSRTPAWLYGSGVDVAAPFSQAADVEAAARELIAANANVLRADPENLRLANAPHALGKWAANFQQTYAGLDVWQGRVNLTFTDAGRLFVMGSTYYPGIAVDPVPTLSADEAGKIAWDALPCDPATDTIAPESQLLILPVPLSETEVEHHLVWRVRVNTQQPRGIWVTHVDAHDGEIVWRYNGISFADFSGDVDGPIEPGTWCNGVGDQALRYMRVTVAGVGETITDEFGNWTVPYGGNDAHEVSAMFYGPYVDVNNMAGLDGTYTTTMTPGVPQHIEFDTWWGQQDELDCFDAVNDIHDFFMTFAPEFPYIHQRITCNVSIYDQCNAFWDGTINFFQAGGGCANTGQIQGVVEHEFGHGVQNLIMGGWQGNEGLGEGNSDVLANLMTQESVCARGFYLDDCYGGIRDSDNDLIYPDDVIDQEIHYAGQVIAGFHWDFMVAAEDAYGQQDGTLLAAQLWHTARLLSQPATQCDQVWATFVADDDDGNLLNGTPHYDMLVPAAVHHHFPYPEIPTGVEIIHDPVWTMTEEGDAEVLATIFSYDAAMNPDSIVVRYSLNDAGLIELRMTPTGGENQYHTFITDLHFGDLVDYYIRAVDMLGNAATHPENAPNEMHTFGVATVYDPMEVESGWVVNLEGTDTAPRGIWVREDPNGTRAQPEDDHTPDPGVVCWVTGNGPPGYPPGAYDVDHGVTTVYSPVYDLTGARTALASYWRWYSNDGDASPYEDYWGVWVRNNGGPWQVVEYTNNEDENAWVPRGADLLQYFGDQIGQVQFKYAAADTGGLSMVEACVDDFEIIARMISPVIDPSVPENLRFAFYGTRSMPVVGATDVSFEVPGQTRVELTIFDVGGRVLRTLADDVFAAGRHVVPWDSRDASGRELASGVYYCRMRSPGFTATRMLVLSR